MDKDEIITIIERLIEDSGLELENDEDGDKINRLISNIANVILDIQDDEEADVDEVVDVISLEFPKKLRNDDDWMSLAEEIASEIVPLLEPCSVEDEIDE